MECLCQIEKIRADFIKSKKLLITIGDETRQNIITVLMGIGYGGLRVGEITANTHLSRPAVSHHMRILLDCGLVTVHKQGTKNDYSLNIGEEFESMYRLISRIMDFKATQDAGLFDKAIGHVV
ncbi:MAG TPA: ArsR family transcriptional regulator [Ruminococcaceae bacterium]|nr:ArsR family transcriptional regulator [Oscillospiraceae bacterium]